jgi:putative Holliday junction resolvase
VSDIPAKGRLLAVDAGRIRVGLAVCDADRRIASPLETYTRRSEAHDADYFRKLIEIDNIVALVVGLPISLNGTEGPKALECRQYGAWLEGVTGLPVAFHDERFTTSQAEDALWDAGLSHKKRKDRRDRVAAQLILQGYLEAHSA